MKHIVVHECYESVEVGVNKDNLTEKEFNELEKYVVKSGLDIENIIFTRNSVRFINYVGYISLKSVAIEILPKLNIDRDINEDKKILLRMILKSNYLNVKYSSIGFISNYNISLKEIFISLLVDLIEKELRKGIYSTYTTVNDEIDKLKGRLDVKKQIKNKMNNKAKAWCTYDEFSINNELNKKLFYIIDSLLKLTKNNVNIKKLKYSRNLLGDIQVEGVDNLDFIFNRLNERFRDIFILAKIILGGKSSNGKKGKDEGYSFLFKMNEVFELYIGKLIKEIKVNSVITQQKKYKLLVDESNGRKIFNLIPDIVIEEQGVEKIIIDTKWKNINRNYNRYGVKREDLYQMYAYLTRYREVDRCILLYPYNATIESGKSLAKWSLEENNEKFIEVFSINLRDEKNIKEDLKNILI